MLSLFQALLATAAMGLAILACRALPFLLFRGGPAKASPRLLAFVERTVPPVAMTVLAAVSVFSSLRSGTAEGPVSLASALLTALLHLWRRNALLSILGGTGVYILLNSIFMQ